MVALSCMYKQLYIPYILHSVQCTVYMFTDDDMDPAHAERLGRRREQERDKRASEIPKRREERLRVRRERDWARRAIRVANATADKTQARLQQLSAAQRARHYAESADQRQARLLQISASQTERRAAETVAETEVRLDRDRERHRAQCRVQPQPSLLEQPVVHHQMCAFHRHLSKLKVAQCIPCCEADCACSTDHIIALFLAQARPTDDYHLPSNMYAIYVCML